MSGQATLWFKGKVGWSLALRHNELQAVMILHVLTEYISFRELEGNN